VSLILREPRNLESLILDFLVNSIPFLFLIPQSDIRSAYTYDYIDFKLCFSSFIISLNSLKYCYSISIFFICSLTTPDTKLLNLFYSAPILCYDFSIVMSFIYYICSSVMLYLLNSSSSESTVYSILLLILDNSNSRANSPTYYNIGLEMSSIQFGTSLA